MDSAGKLDAANWADSPTQGDLKSSRYLTIGMVAVNAVTLVAVGGPLGGLLVVSCALAGAAFLAKRINRPLASTITGVALAGQGIVFTAVFAGHELQLDSHMLFFVILAVVALMQSIQALVVTAAVIATHHLSFGLLMPALVFPSLDLLINLERIAMHATVVVMEVSVLSVAILARKRQDDAEHEARVQAIEATENARAMAVEAQDMRNRAEAASRASLLVTTLLERNLHAMARQDLSGRLTDEVSDEFQQLICDYNTALDTMSVTLAETLELVGEVEVEATASANMTGEMAQQLEGQSKQVTHAAGAIRTLTVSLEDTSNDIVLVRDRATDAAGKATEGGGIVRKAVDAMAEIKASSNQIEKIIGVIEEISFQTNLLALNAGVEAARAGQAGAGFAVVASEVRALSHRTSEAANQVKTLITRSVTHVANGSDMVDQAGAALNEIESMIADASHRITDLSRRASQQAGAVQDVSKNLAELDTGVQSSAVKTQDLATINVRVRRGAAKLSARIGKFRLDAARPREPERVDMPLEAVSRPAA